MHVLDVVRDLKSASGPWTSRQDFANAYYGDVHHLPSMVGGKVDGALVVQILFI